MTMEAGRIVEETIIAAPAARVFAALTNPEERRRWWGGPRFEVLGAESDLRVGGAWSMTFEAYGRRSSVRGIYRVIEPPRKLAFTWIPDWYADASETLVTIELREAGGRTAVRLTHSGLATQADRANHRGWPDVLTGLRTYAESVTAPA